MSTDVDIPEFTQADVVFITSVNAKTLQNWTDPNRGILRLSQGSVGKGRRRLYSPLDIMSVVLISQLAALGIAPNVVSHLLYDAEKISSWLKEAYEKDELPHVCRIFFGPDGLLAQLVVSREDEKIFVGLTEDWSNKRFAFIQVSLSDIAAFVKSGIYDIRIEEIAEEELTPAERSVKRMRKHIQESRTKDG